MYYRSSHEPGHRPTASRLAHTARLGHLAFGTLACLSFEHVLRQHAGASALGQPRIMVWVLLQDRRLGPRTMQQGHTFGIVSCAGYLI